MLLNMHKGKIHRATVTEANLNYVGSITIDKTLIDAAGILPGERVQIVNNNNGARLETYVIEGEADSGMICLNGAAARLVQPGDHVIIIAYCWIEEEHARSFKPKVIFVNGNNKMIEKSDMEMHGDIK
ncbi:aspartate 1-decarboxylase [Marinisporobacter balticus]|uniref:Aspartate 1-decarboxylase n=1 Tax=Marinisporobacter balticus TaxID=2018667 RepID=A0A4R2KX63_9FIRM|nr:aspartate 1-decarboxylase [Marinisporobacter balticus]TCO77467.1 L-aspartate 1-decarboxylase [Marinisporobacter balticus]